MFSVIISEKGGAERRETFDRTEINVGRVQGNDLMLPKGNVSKRHARLLCRDGRFIVTDLKSTNGTYVNGRKIAQATIVREGDKIYIGDFVLRIESGGGPLLAASSSSSSAALPVLDDMEGSGPNSSPLDPMTSATAMPVLPMGPPAPLGPPPPALGSPGRSTAGMLPPGTNLAQTPPAAMAQDPALLKSSSLPAPPSSSEPSSPERPHRPSAPRAGERPEVISHFPLEQDPDDSVHFAVPAAPRVPSPPRAASGRTLPAPGLAPPPGGRAPQAPPPAPPPPSPSGASAPPPRPPGPHERPTSQNIPQATFGAPAGTKRASADGARNIADHDTGGRLRNTGERAPIDPGRVAAHRAALVALVDRVGELVDLRPLVSGAPPDEDLLARLERSLASAAAGMRGQSDLDVDALVVEARRELCEYGPLTPLFDDEDVTELQVVRHDHVVAVHGRRQVPSDVGFSSEQAVGRAIRRLCLAAGKPLAEGEIFVERRLARGSRLFAVMPRAEEHGHMVVIRKPQRADLSLEDLVRSGTISRAVAGLMSQCVAARGNILVTGAVGAGTTTLIGALAGAGSTEDRVLVLQEDDELIFNQPHTISILLGETPEEGARAVQAAARVRPDRLVVGAFAGATAAELVDVMGDGVDGVIAGARAPTLRQAVLRLTADIAATKPGLSPEVAREWLASVFDLAIEVARLRDGRHRVLRVAELGVEGNKIAIRDIFTFTVERTAAGGAIEGSFTATGLVPGILEDLAARGAPVDLSTFRRHAKADVGDSGQAHGGQAHGGQAHGGQAHGGQRQGPAPGR